VHRADRAVETAEHVVLVAVALRLVLNRVLSEVRRHVRCHDALFREVRVERTQQGEGHQASEQAAAAMEFLDKFRKLPVNEMDEEKMQSVVLPLLKQF